MQCPHCREHFHDNWHKERLQLVGADGRVGSAQEKGIGVYGTLTTKCPSCEHIIVGLGFGDYPTEAGSGVRFWMPTRSWLVHPKTFSRAPIPPEVPEEFATDYREACLVLPDSEKASAALSRRCLQHVIREKTGIRERTLDQEIQKVLDSKQLPSYLADDLDAVRNIGNFAGHPMKNTNTGEIIDVEPGEAEWLLNVLEGLFDFYFVQPAKSKAQRDALNAKLTAAGKPPMKTR